MLIQKVKQFSLSTSNQLNKTRVANVCAFVSPRKCTAQYVCLHKVPSMHTLLHVCPSLRVAVTIYCIIHE